MTKRKGDTRLPGEPARREDPGGHGEEGGMPGPNAPPWRASREPAPEGERAPTAEEEATRRRQLDAEKERARPLTRELVEFETAAEGVAGSGLGQSGTLPSSVGGTTGTAGRSAGIQTPGARVPSLRGMSPERARRLRERGRGEED